MKITKQGLITFFNQLPLYFFAFAVVIVVVLLTFIFTANPDVLKDWHIKVDSSRHYKPGDTLKIQSSGTKLKDASPDSTRYLQCLKEGIHAKLNDGYKIKETDWDGYTFLNKNNNNASQPLGHFSSTFEAALPLSAPSLPNTCRIYVYVNYKVYNIRNHPEYTYSNNFIVEPLDKAPVSVGDGTPLITIYGNPEQLSQPNQVVRLQPTPREVPVPTISPTPAPQPQPTNPQQETPNQSQNTPPIPNPGLLDRVLGGVGGVLNSLLEAL